MKTIITQMPNRRNFLQGKYAIEIGYPWITYGSIMAIEAMLKPEHNVLELGSGGSTIFWSKRCNSVKSYELNKEWMEKVKVKLPEPSNVTMTCGEPEVLVEVIRKEPNEYYDWLLADTGPSYGVRFALMRESIPKLKKGGFLVIDNYAKRYMNRFDYTGWDVYTFDDFGHVGKGTKICVKI